MIRIHGRHYDLKLVEGHFQGPFSKNPFHAALPWPMLTTLPSNIQLNHSSGVALPLLSITITVSQLSVLSGFTLHLSGHQVPLAESQDGLLQPMNPCFLPCLIFIYIMIERGEKEKKGKRERKAQNMTQNQSCSKGTFSGPVDKSCILANPSYQKAGSACTQTM